jgi:transposase
MLPLLPAQKPETGRPSNDHRTMINGILWILRTGAPWRDLPSRYGRWETLAVCFTVGLKVDFGRRFYSHCSNKLMRRGNWIGECIM